MPAFIKYKLDDSLLGSLLDLQMNQNMNKIPLKKCSNNDAGMSKSIGLNLKDFLVAKFEKILRKRYSQ